MFNLIAIGDPVIDTHVEIDDSSAECRVIPHENLKLCLDYGSKIPIRHSFQSLGGNACNVSLGATKLGLKTTILSTVGDDSNGATALRELAKHGVDTSFISIDKKTLTRYSIILDYQKDRTILAYSCPRHYVWPKHIPKTQWIYFSDIGEGFEEIEKSFLNFLKKNPGVKLAFNPGSHLLKYSIDTVLDLISKSDILIVNLEEAQQILGHTHKKEKNAPTLLRLLMKLKAKEVVITDAERGSWAGNKNEIWHMKSFPITVVSKTGAGDAFSAGYIAAKFHGHNLKNALVWGTASSAGVIKHTGSNTGLLDQKSLQKIVNEFKLIVPFEI